MNRKGWTITELIVVLAIISIMLAMFFPAVQRARESAREVVCKNNISQINLSLSQYSEVAGIPEANPMEIVGGWTIVILPFLEQGNLQDAFPTGRPLNELPSQHFTQPRILRCPTQSNSRPDNPDSVSPAHYVLIAKQNLKRQTFSLADAPLSLASPWVSSPELTSRNSLGNDGPHHGGYHYAGGFQNGVTFYPTR